MYLRALAGEEKALGPDHSSTLDTVNRLGVLYAGQGKLEQAEKMYLRALAGLEKALGPGHPLTLNTVNCLGCLGLDLNRGNGVDRANPHNTKINLDTRRCTSIREP